MSNDEKLSRDEVRRRIRLASTHNQHSGPRPLHTWESPDWSILDDRRGELPDFPLDCLGEPLQQWVERAAIGAGVTAAHVAVPALGIASSLVGMARRVRASPSWLEPMTCWVGIVGESGTGKTPGIDAVKRALAQIERDSLSKIADLQRKHETRVENAKAARAAWKDRVAEAVEAGLPPPTMPEDATDPGKFVAPRLYVSDGTIERFGELLQARPQGVLRLTDELSAMFTNMSRYSVLARKLEWQLLQCRAHRAHSSSRPPSDRCRRRLAARQACEIVRRACGRHVCPAAVLLAERAGLSATQRRGTRG